MNDLNLNAIYQLKNDKLNNFLENIFLDSSQMLWLDPNIISFSKEKFNKALVESILEETSNAERLSNWIEVSEEQIQSVMKLSSVLTNQDEDIEIHTHLSDIVNPNSYSEEELQDLEIPDFSYLISEEIYNESEFINGLQEVISKELNFQEEFSSKLQSRSELGEAKSETKKLIRKKYKECVDYLIKQKDDGYKARKICLDFYNFGKKYGSKVRSAIKSADKRKKEADKIFEKNENKHYPALPDGFGTGECCVEFTELEIILERTYVLIKDIEPKDSAACGFFDGYLGKKDCYDAINSMFDNAIKEIDNAIAEIDDIEERELESINSVSELEENPIDKVWEIEREAISFLEEVTDERRHDIISYFKDKMGEMVDDICNRTLQMILKLQDYIKKLYADAEIKHIKCHSEEQSELYPVIDSVNTISAQINFWTEYPLEKYQEESLEYIETRTVINYYNLVTNEFVSSEVKIEQIPSEFPCVLMPEVEDPIIVDGICVLSGAYWSDDGTKRYSPGELVDVTECLGWGAGSINFELSYEKDISKEDEED